MGRVSFADDVKKNTIDEFEEIEEEPVNIYPYENTPDNMSWAGELPKKQGVYEPELEIVACGVGFAANIKGKASHKIVTDGMYYRHSSTDDHMLNICSTPASLQYDPPRCGWVRCSRRRWRWCHDVHTTQVLHQELPD